MKLTPEQERIKTLLSETITLLCKNGLSFKNKFSIEALVGITLDDNDVLLLSIRETVRTSDDFFANDEDSLGQHRIGDSARDQLSQDIFRDSTTDAIPRNQGNLASTCVNEVTEVKVNYAEGHHQSEKVPSSSGKRFPTQHLNKSTKPSCSTKRQFKPDFNHTKSKLSKYTNYETNELGEVHDLCELGNVFVREQSSANLEKPKPTSDRPNGETEHNICSNEVEFDIKSELIENKHQVDEGDLDIIYIKEEHSFKENDGFDLQNSILPDDIASNIDFVQARLMQGHSGNGGISDNGGLVYIEGVNAPVTELLFSASDVRLEAESRGVVDYSADTDDRTVGQFGQHSTLPTFYQQIECSNIILRCRYCDEILPTMPEYLRHISQKHRSSQDFYKYPCPCCEKSFSSHTNFRGHMSKHTGIKEFVCPYCGRGYSFKQMLKDHVNQHLMLARSSVK